MAKFVNGASSYSTITEIINGAQRELFIVAPYIKIPQQTKNYIKNVDTRHITFTIISRVENSSEKNVDDTDIHFLRGLTSANIRVCENLHAKCFLNESEGLITSMNLHEHSQTHNWEMGVRFTKAEDPVIYNAAFDEVQIIVKQSKENPKIKFTSIDAKTQTLTPKPILQKSIQKPKMTPKKGLLDNIMDTVLGEQAFCIRCGEPMDKFNTDNPLCSKCYPIWAKYHDPNYKEQYCHYCGEKKSSISYAKPVCYGCYQEMNKKPRE
jgi:hypothetical protein